MYNTKISLNRHLISLSLVLLVILSPLRAQTSTFVGILGTLDVPSNQINLGARGNIEYRTQVDTLGSLKISSYGEVLYNTEQQSFTDMLTAGIESIWYLHDDELLASLGSQFSLLGNEDSNPYWVPDWNISYHMFRGYRSYNPFISYSGYATKSQIYNGIQLGFSYSPRVELTYTLAAEGGFDSSFDSNQQDTIASLEFAISGLVGYYMNWEIGADVTWRESSDVTQEGLNISLAGNTTLAFSRWLQVQIAQNFRGTYVSHTRIWEMAAELIVRVDTAISNHIYLYASPTITFSNLLDSATPTMIFTLGVDVGF